MKKVLWLGAVFSEKDALSEPGVSLAANRWQLGMMRALSAKGYEIEVCGHKPVSSFPKGNLKVKSSIYNEDNIKGYYFSYCNIVGLREIILSYCYLNAIKKLIDKYGKPDLIIVYNLEKHLHRTIEMLKNVYDLNVYAIIADVDKKELTKHYRIETYCDKLFYLSYAFYLNSKHKNKVFWEGGIDSFKGDEDDVYCSPKIIMYTGSLGGHGGLDLLLDAYKLLNRDDAELWIFGKGHNVKLVEMSKHDKTIKYFGAVSEKELQKSSKKAFLFVNPRPANYENNYYNFPSKILEYLSYNKIIVSTKTAGLSPEYDMAVEFIKDETSDELCKAINNILNFKKEEYKLKIRQQKKISKEKLWDKQIHKLIRPLL